MTNKITTLDKQTMLEIAKDILKRANKLVKAIENNDAEAAFEETSLYYSANILASGNINSFRKALDKKSDNKKK